MSKISRLVSWIGFLVLAVSSFSQAQTSPGPLPMTIEKHRQAITGDVLFNLGNGGSGSHGVSQLALAYDAHNRKVLGIGGFQSYDSSGHSGTYILDPVLNLSNNTKPTFRSLDVNHGLTFVEPPTLTEHRVVYHPVTRKIYLFGGKSGSTVQGDLWEINLSPAAAPTHWVLLNSSPAPRPSPRFHTQFGAFVDPATQIPYLIVYGGYRLQLQNPQNPFSPLITVPQSDVWFFNLNTNTWSQPGLPTQLPALGNGGIVWDSIRRRLVVAGGTSVPPAGNYPMNSNTYEWDGNVSQPGWTLLSGASGSRGFPRIGAAFAFDEFSGKTVAFGGSVQGNGTTNVVLSDSEIYELLPNTTGWTPRTQVPGLENFYRFFNTSAVAPRQYTAMVYVADRKSLFAVGGGVNASSPTDSDELLEFHAYPSSYVNVGGPPMLYPSGCVGAGTQDFVRLEFENLPAIGQVSTLTFSATNFSAGQFAGAVFGSLYPPSSSTNSTTTWRPIPDGLGCRLYVDVQFQPSFLGPYFWTNASVPHSQGSIIVNQFPFFVPNYTGFLGSLYYFQAFAVDPQYGNGFRTSSVPAVVLGY